MAANGGGSPPPPPFMVKKEGGLLELDDHDHDENHNMIDDDHHVGNISNNMKGISIAERRAAKCGFNAANINAAAARTGQSSPHLQSPYVTIPPGISPSALLDSPILLPNAQAQLSPTTGTFHHKFPLLPNHERLKLKLKLASEDSTIIIPMDSSSASSNLPAFEDYFEYPMDFQEMSKNDCLEKETVAAKTDDDQCLISLQQQQQQQLTNTRNQIMFREIRNNPINYDQEKHHNQKGIIGAYIPKEYVAKHSEDGFYWRKYGQKHVKGSEFPRSYYKCTNANCLVKKKVERSHAGEITQIVYKGSHNHPIPQPAFKRLNDHMPCHDDGGGGGGGTSFKAQGAKAVPFGSDIHNWMTDDGATSSSLILSDFSDPLSVRNFDQPTVETQDFSSSNNIGSQDGAEDQNKASPDSISFKNEDDENGECEPKKRKRETNSPNETTIPRSARESKVVVQIESDVDILDDGYRWRKYGQKVVKGNPNPRSYYKCTTPGCPVRKHVERASDDIKSVLTTYEGKHNHEVPTRKTGSLAISDHVVANNKNTTISNPSPMAQKHDHVSKSGKQIFQDLPLYMERKNPILNYNDFMRPNLHGNISGHDLGFGGPSNSLYPYNTLPSLAYNSLLMNGNNHMISPSSKFYPDYYYYTMSLPSQIRHVQAAGVPNNNNNNNIGCSFPFNNYYAAFQNSTECQTGNYNNIIMKPKEEEEEEEQTADNEGELLLYDTCMSIPNQYGRN